MNIVSFYLLTDFSPIDGSHTGKILSFHINLRITNIDAIDGSYIGKLLSTHINLRITNIDAIDGSYIGKLLSAHINLTTNLDAIDRSGIIGCIIVNLCGFLLQVINRRLLPIRCRLQFANSGLICIRLIHGSLDISQCGGHARAILDRPLHRQHVRFHISTRNRGTADGSHIFQLLAVIREIGGFVLQSGPLILQVIYFLHQSAGSITNLGCKICNRSFVSLSI